MAFLMARLDVDDYETWKSGTFDRDPARRDGTAKGHRLYRDTEDPNAVIVEVEFESTNAARAFRERLQASGTLDGIRLPGPPRVCEEAEAITY
jgi:hypothetical protein